MLFPAFLCDRQQSVVVNSVKSDRAHFVRSSQSTVLGLLFFSLYINDITEDNDPELKPFAYDCVCYHETKNSEDMVKL